ncbi:MAG: hypothetical protein M1426_00140 [Patescibacteria group bacterium]|nr:hypothetical protein [Patescibacteria group bacterium]
MKNGVAGWLKDNLWNLIITFVAIIIAFVTMQARITAVELKEEQLSKKVAEYPSQDFFNLKFQTIESNLNEIKQDLKEHLQETR